MTDQELLQAIRGIVRAEAASILKDELQPVTSKLDTLQNEVEGLKESVATLQGDVNDLKESVEEVRSSTNALLEWAEECGNVIKFPLPKVK